MAWRQRCVLGLAGMILGLTGAVAHAGPYSAMYVFGDSLSDVGNDARITGGAVPKSTIYTDGTVSGRFTNGTNYIDGLSSDLGLSVTPSTLGGTDYAYGGARITYGLVPGALSFNQQISSFVTGLSGGADPNALYVMWIGANDMFDAIQAAVAAGNPAPIADRVTASMGYINDAINTLAQKGAQNFLLINLPDLALTPEVRSYGGALDNTARSASTGFNKALAGLVAQPVLSGLDITLLDVFSAQTAISNDPAAYGFTNTGTACYNGDVNGALRAPATQLSVCPDASGYMYFDYIHPSSALHARIGDLAYDALTVPEPASLSLLLGSLGMMGYLRRRQMRA